METEKGNEKENEEGIYSSHPRYGSYSERPGRELYGGDRERGRGYVPHHHRAGDGGGGDERDRGRPSREEFQARDRDRERGGGSGGGYHRQHDEQRRDVPGHRPWQQERR
jgi:hypothetical protein